MFQTAINKYITNKIILVWQIVNNSISILNLRNYFKQKVSVVVKAKYKMV